MKQEKYIKGARCVCGKKFVHCAVYPDASGDKEIEQDFAQNEADGRKVEILPWGTAVQFCMEATCANAVGKSLIPKEPEQINIPLFKQQLSIFLKQQFGACSDILDEIETAQTLVSIKSVLRRNGEHIVDKLCVDIECEKCNNKNSRIEKLKYEKEVLQDEIDELKYDKSIPYHYKRESFESHQDKYSFIDFENLMQNGHKVLPIIH